MLKKILPIILAGVVVSGARAAVATAAPREVDYSRESVEYAALCAQVYRDAWAVLSRRVKDQAGPWAVVLDADETVLDNSEGISELRRSGRPMDAAFWQAWVRRKQAKAVPGARKFLDRVRAAGGEVVFITDRLPRDEAATRENMRALGLLKDGDGLLAKLDSRDTKDARRACVEKGAPRCASLGPRRILATFGDSLRDHVEVYGADARRLRGQVQDDPSWGTTRFVLPNPLYGQWENGYSR